MIKAKNRKLCSVLKQSFWCGVKIYQIFFLVSFLLILSFFISQEAKAACLDVPLKGTFTMATSCVLTGTVNGADDGGVLGDGNIIIPSGITLTMSSNQTIVWSPGSSIIIEGALVINKAGGNLKKTYLWYTDSDDDHFPDNLVMVAADDAPPNAYRRSSSHFSILNSECGITTVNAVSCGGGRWLDGNGDCVLTPEGYYSPKCDNLKYAASIGYYVSGTGKEVQTECSDGSYTNSTGQSSCSTCSAGYSCTGGTMVACTAGNYSISPFTSCITCTAGYRCAGSADRVACVAGTYQASTGQSTCTAATAGYYVSTAGATAQTACGGNTVYCPGTSQTGTTAVTSGYYSTGGTATTRTGQSQCTAGNYCVSGVQTAASDGYYVSTAGATAQTACGGNTVYCPGTSRTAPTTVTSGYYSTGGTATTRTGQSQCTAGNYCVSGVQTAASAGYYVSTAGATGQFACAAGYYQPSTGQSSCLQCGTCTYSYAAAVACISAGAGNTGFNCTAAHYRCTADNLCTAPYGDTTCIPNTMKGCNDACSKAGIPSCIAARDCFIYDSYCNTVICSYFGPCVGGNPNQTDYPCDTKNSEIMCETPAQNMAALRCICGNYLYP